MRLSSSSSACRSSSSSSSSSPTARRPAAAPAAPPAAACRPRAAPPAAAPRRRPLAAPPRAVEQQQQEDAKATADALRRSINKTAATFAPRQSGASKPNPAYRGSWLYTVFEAQAWLAVLVGGLLSFNVLLPTDDPSIPRLMGMWSVWVFTVPSLRARECTPKEKDALNVLFLLIPLINVTIPIVWRSFAGVFSADVLALGLVYAWKGAWAEVYGIGGEALVVGAAAPAEGEGEGEVEGAE